jgi:protein-S-isoprenylcysteine O-methyltransferase Ste14
MDTQTNPETSNNGISALTWKVVFRMAFTALLMLAVLFLAAGRLDWWEAWAYVNMSLVILLGSRGILVLKYPDLALERAQARGREGVKAWDKILMPIVAFYGPLVSWVVAGLDVRFGWSPDLPDAIQWAALAVIALGSLIGTWAMLTNRFFSSHVRIQTDRGHTVVNTGPYRYVRHPGYAGGLLSWLAGPFFFSSYWVAIPTILVIFANILRTSLEDRALQEELPGYREYAAQVRYRLVPGVW